MTFAVFDIETRVDKDLLNRTFFPHDNIEDDEAFRRFAENLRNGFFPPSLHIPISIAIGDVGENYLLRSVESLALADYSEEKLAREFWNRIERFKGWLVSFNGRRFDLPVLELAALRFGIPAPGYFTDYDSPRSPEGRHLDLLEFLTNRGAVSLRGGMNLLLKMIGMPGKMGIDGSRVQGLYEAGRLDDIHRYCRCDVVQTYFLFLRIELMRGRIDPAIYADARAAAEHFMAEFGALPAAGA
ncbi:MAG: 3'-5' exonuclease [Candidatus Binataceae bacterium]